MTTKPKSAAKIDSTQSMTDLFQAAMKSYEEALKSGIGMQEESVKLWKDLLGKLGTPEELQKRLEEMSSGAIPEAHDRMEEFLNEFKRSSSRSMDLLSKAMAVPTSSSVPEVQNKLQDLMEASLGSLRSSVQSALNTNARIMNNWQDLVDKAVTIR